MRNLAKRILSLIVVAVVMITSLPFSVMAETAANTDGKGMTIDLSKTDESIDEVLNNIQGLNALANGEKENAHQHGSSEKHTHTVDAQEVITDSESNSFEDGIFDIVVEETVEQEVDVKLESTTTKESPATDFEYSIENGEVTIKDYIGSATEVVIPEKIEGYPVTSIGYAAFYYCSSLTSIAIPNGVTSIEYGAFYGCSSLTSITIPDSVTSIGDDAFSYCSALTSVTIPDSVTSIGWGAFFWCYSLNHVYYSGNEAEWRNITIDSDNENLINSVVHYDVMQGSEFKITVNEATCTINKNEMTFCNYCDFLLSLVEEKETAKGHNYVDGICESCGLSEDFSLSYRFDNDGTVIINGIVIINCDTSATIVEIPATIEGYPVTSIGDDAFSDCSSLTSITIPDSVTSIGDRAFLYCSSLTSITIPDSVTSIGDVAFYACYSLESITIPDSVTSIGGAAFSGCSSLTSITVSADNHTYLSENGVLFNKAKTEIICCPGGKVGEYTIPDSVTSIGGAAFENCSSLTSITIPDSVTSIGDSALRGCSSLTSITIPDSVTSIEACAFYNCSSLTSITIPDGVTSIGDYAFYYCISLTSITIPDSVTSIGDSAFTYCYNLNHIYYTGSEADWNNITIYAGNENLINSVVHYDVMPGSEFKITVNEATCTINKNEMTFCNYCDFLLSLVKETAKGHNYVDGICESCGLSEDFSLSYRFDNDGIVIINCDTSATIVEIPATIEGYPVTSIGDYAFYNCSSLRSITIPDSVTSIGDYAFYNCSSLRSITIPDSVTSIGNSAFYCCSALTSITIPDSVTSIGWCAFEGCSSLKSITIPDSVTSIGWGAFYYCSALESITIPDSVTSIGDATFYYCSALESITIPDSVTSIGDEAFSNCSSLTSITVSADNHTYSSDDGVLLNKEKTILICCPGGKVGEYTIPDSVTSVGDYAFYYCSLLTSITIPDSVTSIGDRAFLYCSSLTSITIPDSVTSIGGLAFYGCSSLTSITIPDSVTSIGGSAFGSCSSLTSITIPESVTSIGNRAFYRCSSLTSITISADNLAYLSENGVLFNKAKTEIICCPGGKVGEYTIPDSVTSIGDYAFSGCSSLESITIPDSVTSIGDYAFYYCSSLESITIPDSVTSIGDSAFDYCSSLKTVNYTGSEESWNKISVYSDNDYLLNATIHFNYIPGAIPEEITPSTDSNIVVDSEKSLVTGLTPEMTPADVAAKFEGAEIIQIVGKDGNVLEADALVGTGSKIQLVENGEVIDEVTVVIKGEIDGNGIIDSDDAIYMLRNTLFPDLFPVVVDDDVDGNGVYDSDDAIHLLRYTLFPDLFPLK